MTADQQPGNPQPGNLPSVETHRVPVKGKTGEGQSVVVDWIPPAAEGGMRCAVFVHGLGSHRRGDKAQFFAERFARNGWGYLSVDLRGHGEADGSLRELTLTRCLDDLKAALDWMAEQAPAPEGREGEEPVLIGSSMGGAVIAWHRMATPKARAPLVMIAPALQFPGRLAWQLGPKEMEEWRAKGVRRFDSEWIELELGFQLLEDGLRYDPRKLLQAHASPTLIFHGMRDEAVDWQVSRTFVEDCPYPGLDLVVIKAGDHRLTEHKAFLFDTLWAWLAMLQDRR